jgi:hypothetical protein
MDPRLIDLVDLRPLSIHIHAASAEDIRMQEVRHGHQLELVLVHEKVDGVP